MEQRAPKRRKVESTNHDGSSSDSGPEQRAEDASASSTLRSRRKRMQKSGLGNAYTSETFKSRLFKLQVDELLDQIRLQYDIKDPSIEKTMRSLKGIIEAIPSRSPLSISDAEKSLLESNEIVIPYPSIKPSKTANYKLEYRSPSYINAIGSYPLRLATKIAGKISVDLLVVMPSSIFHEKDYLNYRYFHKRSYFLACLAAGIKDAAGSDFELRFDYLNGNHLQPIIVLKTLKVKSDKNTSIPNYRINIIPAVSHDAFAAEKLLQHKNCIRPSAVNADVQSRETKPTPFYNATIRMDTLMTAYLKLIHSASNKCEAFKDACLLGRIWLRQRGLSATVSGGGFGNFEWSALLALLLQSGGSKSLPPVSSGYSSYQLFKTMLQLLALKNMTTSPLGFQSDLANITVVDGTPVFFDGPRKHNLLYKMTAWSYRTLQYEASSTITALSAGLFDQFESTFVINVNQAQLRYDYLMEMPVSILLQSREDTHELEDLLQGLNKLYGLLLRGLDDRASLIAFNIPQPSSWNIDTQSLCHLAKRNVTVGVVVNPTNSARLVDQGPPAEDRVAAASFRTFWGEKAELRRFKDGSILESVIWSAGEKTVVMQVLLCLLRKQYGQHAMTDINFDGVASADFLGLSQPDTSIGPFQQIMTSFSDLERDLRQLVNLPLAIRHVFATDPVLRYASTFAPLSKQQPTMITPANVILQFEGSNRWPDDLEAIQRTKIAFLLKLRELLTEAISGLSACAGFQHEDHNFVNCSFLDVTYPSGAAFRIRIHQDREDTLLQRLVKDKNLSGPEREEVGDALATYKRDFICRPSHTQAIQMLCTRFPALSPTIMLVKKWFGSHLLSGHIRDEVIELLVVHTFVQPYPWRTPSSPLTGLLRTLHFLSRWDWRLQPLIVDFNGSINAKELSTITTRFEAWRKIDPALNRVILFTASNIDTDGTTWTDHARPAKVVAARMTALAKAACEVYTVQDTTIQPSALFTSSLKDFDFVFHLNSRLAQSEKNKVEKATKSQFKNLQVQGITRKDLNVLCDDLVRIFVEELRGLYGQAVLLFHSSERLGVIAGLWNPNTGSRPWRVRLGYSSMPSSLTVDEAEGVDSADRVRAELNREAVLVEMARLGGELVQRIEVHQH